MFPQQEHPPRSGSTRVLIHHNATQLHRWIRAQNSAQLQAFEAETTDTLNEVNSNQADGTAQRIYMNFKYKIQYGSDADIEYFNAVEDVFVRELYPMEERLIILRGLYPDRFFDILEAPLPPQSFDPLEEIKANLARDDSVASAGNPD